MARPNKTLEIEKWFFDNEAGRVKQAIDTLNKKDSLDINDIQAEQILLDVYKALSNPIQEVEKVRQTYCQKN